MPVDSPEREVDTVKQALHYETLDRSPHQRGSLWVVGEIISTAVRLRAVYLPISATRYRAATALPSTHHRDTAQGGRMEIVATEARKGRKVALVGEE